MPSVFPLHIFITKKPLIGSSRGDCGPTAGHARTAASSIRVTAERQEPPHGVYKCYACRKPFTVKVGTIFKSSHVKLHVWLQAMHLLCSSKKGMSTHQLHRILGVTLQTAWFLSHRIREAMMDLRIDAGPLGGKGMFVEADETFIGGKARNRAYKAPAAKKAVVALVRTQGPRPLLSRP